MTDPNPCLATGCAMLNGPVETCRDHRCPFRWTREAVEDRARRDAKDRPSFREEGAGI